MTVDWSECPWVERIPGKVSGEPVIKGTRVPADTIVIDEELGQTPEQTHDNFPSVPVETIRKIRAWAHTKAAL